MTHRYYDAGAGRFVNRDPIGYKGGINLYGFAGNNPVNRWDPSGFNPDLLDNLADGSYAMGGVITGGLTNWIDHRLGVDGGINRNSTAYHVGTAAGYTYVAVSTVVGGVGVVNGVRAYRLARAVGSATPVVAQVVANGIRGRAFEVAAIRALGSNA